MAKLYFYYSTMNAGKSTTLLQSSFNYRERFGTGKVSSRIGLSQEADLFHADDDLRQHVKQRSADKKIDCVLVDEAQFLSEKQVWQLSDVCDEFGIPVLCYGIRTDFQGQLFPGSKALLAWADVLQELKTICHCGSKANMVVRVDEQGNALQEGSQIEIGGNERYVSLCRKHFKETYS